MGMMRIPDNDAYDECIKDINYIIDMCKNIKTCDDLYE